MNNPQNHILYSIQEGMNSYQKVVNDPEGTMEYLTADLDCTNVTLIELVKGAKSPETTRPFWDQLKFKGMEVYQKPCLYFFEILSPDTTTILEAYRSFREENPMRASAALKKYPPLDTNILYVGKVKKGINSRMYIHLGYYYVGATGGGAIGTLGQ